jgi:glutamine---fructose-6-phosphate transaminase (isomerizing)
MRQLKKVAHTRAIVHRRRAVRLNTDERAPQLMISLPGSGFELDILHQADALGAFAAAPLPYALARLDFKTFDRIILTGMGSSDYVTLGLELVMARRGLPVWRLQTSRLLESVEMITDRTLLWLTSQSGGSGEIVALLDRLPSERRVVVVGVTNDPESALGRGADHVILLRSGQEATVSSKSYLNTLAVHHRVTALIEGRKDSVAVAEIMDVAAKVREAVNSPPPLIAPLAKRMLVSRNPRIALIGSGIDATTALTGALILKESAKVAAEGYIGGEFRHGPLELAGAGLSAFLFGSDVEDVSLQHLARDVMATGSTVVSVGPNPIAGTEHIAVHADLTLGRLAQAMVVVQHLSISLARVGGFVPGAFRYGRKITAQL